MDRTQELLKLQTTKLRKKLAYRRVKPKELQKNPKSMDYSNPNSLIVEVNL